MKTKAALTVFCVTGVSLPLIFTAGCLNAKQRIGKQVTQQLATNNQIRACYVGGDFADLETDLNAFGSRPAIAGVKRRCISGNQLDPVGLAVEQLQKMQDQMCASLITKGAACTRLRFLMSGGSLQDAWRVNTRGLPPDPAGSVRAATLLCHGDPDWLPLNAPKNILHRLRDAGDAGLSGTMQRSKMPPEISASQARPLRGDFFPCAIKVITECNLAEDRMPPLAIPPRRSKENLEQPACFACHSAKAVLRCIQISSNWLLEEFSPHLRTGRTRTPEVTTDWAEGQAGSPVLQHGQIGRLVHSSRRNRGLHLPRLPLQAGLLNQMATGIRHRDQAKGTVWIGVTAGESIGLFTVCGDTSALAKQHRTKSSKILQELKPEEHVEGRGRGRALIMKRLMAAVGRTAAQRSAASGSCFRCTWPQEALNKETPA
ncbi:hypothetical protein K3722_14175 [Leisingera caerulea]|uniref:Uncharacterized protein n=1 Tax=Leisingera caerulea TaxID=506591 RepID=A0ABY5WTJ8_LEICA|nr:hypothetical protein [Leisingera caerulea]UWQ57651.1 hypothetical protein K3722_14175 [Leisingera caerulea]